MPAPIVTVTVSTAAGFSFGSLYGDIAGVDLISAQSFSGFTATNTAAGRVFVLSGTLNDFTYDGDGNPQSGTINQIQILDLSSNVLATETGFSISVPDLGAAIDLYNSNPANPVNSGFDAIFNAYAYNATGNTGNDGLIGGSSADSFDGAAGTNDFVSYQHASGPVTANLGNPAANTGDAAGDTYTNIESLRGSSFNDTLIGDGGNNFLRGGGGGDVLNGGGGGDTADYNYNNGTTGITADLSNPSNNTGEAAGDSYISIENLRGSAFNDVLKGNSFGNNLTGGLGADRFVYSGGADTIRDFNHAQGDTVDLSGADVHSWADLQSHISGTGDTLLTFGANTITLTGVAPGTLDATDFFFTPPPTLMVTINGGFNPSGGNAVYGAQAFDQFLGFGDSTTDSGYFFTHTISNNPTNQNLYNLAKAAGGGLPTTPGSLMNSEVLAQFYGLTAIPLGTAGGTNYAASGATVTGAAVNPNAPSIVNQINSYLTASGGVADPNALYLISGGGNSAKVAAGLDPVASINYMKSEADAMAAALIQLHASGAQYLVIDDRSGTGNLGLTYNNELWSDLSAAGISFIVSDTIALSRNITANPSAYDINITNTERPPLPYDPAHSGAVINPSPSTIRAGWALYGTTLATPDADQTYLWADNEHFAGAGQRAEANYAHGLIENAIPTVGQVFQATPALAGDSDDNPIDITFQWQRFDAALTSWVDISGATNVAYVVQHDDQGSRLRVEAFYTNDEGQSVTAFSPATYAVQNEITITIATPDGDNFQRDNPIRTMALATIVVATESDTHFTLTNVHKDRSFLFDGSNLSYDGNGHVIGGTVAAFHEWEISTGHPIADFVLPPGVQALDLVNALADVKAGNEATFDALTASWAFHLNGNDGNDKFGSGDQSDVLSGGGGNDQLFGGGANDKLYGGDGNDLLVGDGGADLLDGGNGIDRVSYMSSFAPVTADLADSSHNAGGAAGDTYVSIENLEGTGGADTLRGDAGNNVLTGGAGGDVLDGGDGNDTASYASAIGDVTASLFDPGTNLGDAFEDSYISIENLAGGRYDDHLTGDGGDNKLLGGLGDDDLNGGGGNDLLIGGSGADHLDGGDGNDTVSYASSQAYGVFVSLAAGTAFVGDAQDDTFAGIENLTGTSFNDLLEGDGGDNVLKGGAGTDFLSYEHAAGGVTVSLAIKAAQATGGAGTDKVSGFENLIGSGSADTLTGDDGANFIMGGAGDDIVKGGGGSDTLEGGLGNDKLFGGAGSDTFVYAINAFDGGRDSVMDYVAGEDVFDLSGVATVAQYSDLHMVEKNGNVVINFGGGNTLNIHGTDIATLDAHQTDFHFV